MHPISKNPGYTHSMAIKMHYHRGSTGPAEPLLRTTATTNMAAATFVVITNGEGWALNGTAVAAVFNDQ